MGCTSPKCMLVARHCNAVFAGNLYGEPPGKVVWYQGVPRCVVYVPCGRCIACRRDRRMDYTVLQALEASLYVDNWFVTLTYDDAKCDWDVRSLIPKQVQSFNELMRKYCKYHGCNYRFFGCGEYGDLKRRPHYHLSIFGLPASLLKLEDCDGVIDARRSSLMRDGCLRCFTNAQRDENGNLFWQSPVIADRWPFGNHQIYRANKDTFQYVAQYVTKKLFGEGAKEERLAGIVNDYSFQSRPSIGFPWYEKFKDSLSLLDGDNLVNNCISLCGLKDWRIPRVMRRWQEKYERAKYNDVKKVIRRDFPDPPDIDDNRRKQLFDEYRARQVKQNNKHKEIQ